MHNSYMEQNNISSKREHHSIKGICKKLECVHTSYLTICLKSLKQKEIINKRVNVKKQTKSSVKAIQIINETKRYILAYMTMVFYHSSE